MWKETKTQGHTLHTVLKQLKLRSEQQQIVITLEHFSQFLILRVKSWSSGAQPPLSLKL